MKEKSEHGSEVDKRKKRWRRNEEKSISFPFSPLTGTF
jgi:hypothetical protein